MAPVANSRDAFDNYWKAYSSKREASLGTKSHWSAATIDKGIVSTAVRSLCAVMGGLAFSHVKVDELEGRACVNRTSIVYGRVRATSIGFASQISSAAYDEIENLAREALCLCVLARSDLKVWPLPHRPSRYGAAGILAVYPDDIDALGRGDWSLAELVEYKLHRRLILDKPDPETQFDSHLLGDFRQTKARANTWRPENLDEILEQLGEDQESWVEHPLIDRVKRILSSGRNCLLTGPSSSGKSILAFQCSRQLALSGRNILYLGLGTLHAFAGGWLNDLVAGSAAQPSLFVVDDLQSSPATARYLLAVGNLVRRAYVDAPPVLLAIAWPDFASAAANWMEDCVPLAVRPHQVAPTILRVYGSGLKRRELEELEAQFGTDLLILRKSLERAGRIGKRPDIRDVANDIWESRTSTFVGSRDIPERVALIAGSLGRFDIFTPRPFLYKEARIGTKELSDLEKAGLIRRIGDSYTLGHRSLCTLLTDWLSKQGSWQRLSQKSGPANLTAVVLDYLKSDTSALALDTLRALHAKAGFKEAPQLNRRTASIVEIWKALDSVAERIEHQQIVDPTWNRTPSSAMFAIQALCEVGKKAVAQASLEFLGQHWRIVGNSLEISATHLSTQNDFERIRERMEEEDRMLEDAGSPLPWDRTGDIDFGRFHKTWLAGVFLCSEAAFLGDPTRLESMVRAIEAMSLSTGAFYPTRVPWSTARVLIGLATCGRTVDTSPCVLGAVRWLMKDKKDGGAGDSGIWRSGTGTWNSDLETTAMVLLALSMAGVDCAGPQFAKARAYLASQRPRWIAPSHELDGALSLQAYLAIGGNWEDVVEEAQYLSRWALGESLWRSTPTSAEQLFKQSCSVAQIASHLVNIAWAAIRSDLPAFLDALAPTEVLHEPLSGVREEAQAIEPPSKAQAIASGSESDNDVVGDCIRSLSAVSLRDCTVVGQYRRHDERVKNRLKDWSTRISKPLRTKSLVRENFLLWAAPGSGKSFFVQEIGRMMGSEVRYVEINLARQSRESISQLLGELVQSDLPTLCLIDEVDVRANETWPYEDIFPLLDLNLSGLRRNVFVLIGSMSSGLEGLARHISGRHKGTDLLDRIPVDRRFEIPPLSMEDKIVIVAGALLDASRSRNQVVTDIEKFGLYFVLRNEELRSPRQLRDFATDAVQRMPIDESRLRYEDMFHVGDRRTYEFWARNQMIAQEFSDLYVRIDPSGDISHNGTQQAKDNE